MPVILTILILLLLLVFYCCFYFFYSPKVKKKNLNITELSETIEIDGVTRSFHTVIPKAHVEKMPLIFVFHGTMQKGKTIRKAVGYEFDEIAESNGVVIVYPDAYKGSWNDARKVGDYPARIENIDETKFVEQMIAYFESNHNVDPHCVFGVGFSNGGQLIHRLASNIPQEFKGLAAIMATHPTMDNFIGNETGGEVPMLLVAGTDDHTVPYHGGLIQLFFLKPRGFAMSAYKTAEFYAKRNGISSPPTVEFLPHLEQSGNTAVIRATYRDTDKKTVELYTAAGVGHVFPNKYNRFPRIMGKSTFDLDTPYVIWSFFKQYI